MLFLDEKSFVTRLKSTMQLCDGIKYDFKKMFLDALSEKVNFVGRDVLLEYIIKTVLAHHKV